MDKLVNLKFDWSTDSITFNGNGKLSTLNSGKGEYQALRERTTLLIPIM